MILQAKQYTENNQRTYDLIEILKNETISSSDYDDDMESDDNLISLSYKAMNNLTESEDDSNFSNDSNDNEFVPNLNDQYSPLDYGIEFLQEYSSNNLFTESKRIKINEMYIQWMISPVSNILKWTKNIPKAHDLWEILSFKKEWQEISSIAIRNLSIPASEASAERMFSKQRFSISKYRYRTKKN